MVSIEQNESRAHSETHSQLYPNFNKKSGDFKDIESTRDRLLTSLHDSLTKEDSKFIVAFKNATPNWDYLDFKKFPAVQ
jgi:hypothetical protein